MMFDTTEFVLSLRERRWGGGEKAGGEGGTLSI